MKTEILKVNPNNIDLNKIEVDIILAESVKEKGLGLAIMDRLRKAAGE
jgi:L-threonylcarbamoyladenylate synthase